MIEVHFLLEEEDTPVGRSKMPHAPRVGEYIWLQNAIGHKPRVSSWRVVGVAYWVPNHDGGFEHIETFSAVAYVERVKKDAISAEG